MSATVTDLVPQPSTAPIHLVGTLETRAPIEAAWAAFSDTDRFNRVAKLGFEFEEEPQPDGTVKRVGRSQRLGFIKLVWDEHPFRYRSPNHFSVTRVLRGSPAAQIRTRCELRKADSGTRIRYVADIYPRSMLFWPIVALEAYVFTKPQLFCSFRT